MKWSKVVTAQVMMCPECFFVCFFVVGVYIRVQEVKD